MDGKSANYVLQILTSNIPEVVVTVNGNSMNPGIFENDIVKIKKCNEYCIGDILVFRYKHDEIIIHRLLKIAGDTYYCKGDNSFRLEDIKYMQIYGKVIEIIHDGNMFIPTPMSERFLQMSYEVNREFRRLKYDKIKILESEIYKCYYNEYLMSRD